MVRALWLDARTGLHDRSVPPSVHFDRLRTHLDSLGPEDRLTVAIVLSMLDSMISAEIQRERDAVRLFQKSRRFSVIAGGKSEQSQ